MWNGQALPENHDKSLPRTGEDDGHPYGQLQPLVDKGVLRPSGPGRLSLLATLSHGIQGKLARQVEAKLRPIINPKNRAKVRFSMETILFNCRLCACFQEMAPLGLRIVAVQSRAHEDYRSSGRYGTGKLSIYVFVRVLDQMREMGLLDLRVESPRGHLRSSYWPTEALCTLFRESDSDIEVKEFCKEVIILKDETKHLMDYKDTRQTRSMRREVKALNASNALHSVELQLPEDLVEVSDVFFTFLRRDRTTLDYTWQESTSDAQGAGYLQMTSSGRGAPSTTATPAPPPPYLSTTLINNRGVGDPLIPIQLSILPGVTGLYAVNQKLVRFPLNGILPYHRSFCRANWTKGGRWYANVQNIPSQLRRYITIDDERTVELDYNAYHARLLYAQAGAVPDGDPYTIPLDGWEDKASLRVAFKLAFQVFLNVKSRKAAIATLNEGAHRGKPRLEKGFKPADLLDAFLLAHPCLEPFMCSDKGVDLQNLDAEVAAKIFSRFFDTGRAIIGIHDSFVVKASVEGFLREAMVEEFRDRVGQDPVIKRIEGVSGSWRQAPIETSCAH